MPYLGHFSRMISAALANRIEEARKLHFDLLDVHPLLYCEGNPIGIKAAVSLLGLCENYLRVPLVPLSMPVQDQLRNALRRVLRSYALSHPIDLCGT